jgi:ParB family chromosome partitioning protein
MGAMNKRTDAIRSMFTTAPVEMLSADNKTPAVPRVSSGSVRSLKDTFSDVEKENQELRQQIESGFVVIDVDPALIDPSPISDRFNDANDASFELLKESIAKRGQEVPVLIREHPERSGRYQCAFGHRRVRVSLELGRSVKAVLRKLTDKDLVVAQGLENSAREDLSFIERATFAMKLEDGGFDRSVTQEALAIDRAEASKLLSVARSVPVDVVAAIGRAPRIGRGRWQSLAEVLKASDALLRARTAIEAPKFADQDSDARFVAVLSASNEANKGDSTQTLSSTVVVANDGRPIARVVDSRRETKVAVDQETNAGFAAFLVAQLPSLFEAYLRKSQGDSNEAYSPLPATVVE